MPAHAAYIEAFLGGGAVMRLKQPAAVNIGIDVDAGVTSAWACAAITPDPSTPKLTVLQEDAHRWIRSSELTRLETTLLYLDPPYLLSTRTRLLYAAELATSDEHTRLLQIILNLKCMTMISGYPSQLYASILTAPRWRSFKFTAGTHGGKRVEEVWCNFPAALPLHDTRFVGANWRERQRIDRKRTRWTNRLRLLPAPERQCIAEALAAVEVEARGSSTPNPTRVDDPTTRRSMPE
jgi:hypothetical protein